ncbi:adenine-specific DNA-methyltransferase [Marinobacter nauticus]|uniref:Adenine-specific DNA-methyltransferase n=1 Tax=Marinobacter nauticus TaxID=2743 RepID=A0A368X2I6_MARNT|nr:DNA methyltransferase [Marinobacter nauticus]RCW62173.1 adenine-specific DNA-methyltransferase [Marinobacter nauticus]
MSNATQQLKAQQRRQKFADLLREMFQLNQPELDFGLYRIMHARKDDINRFIEQDLPRITQEAFSQYASQDQAQLEAELEEHIKSAKGLGMDPDAIPKVQELKQQLQGGFDLAREEGEVYDALVTFFNRYYNEGDFLSRRVYKDGTYAIPYQGEEVVLHWANKDQYYIKSSETLRDYSFRLNPDAGPGEDPMRVHFKLVDAEAGAKDNNKESDNSRRVFVLDAENPFELITGEATEYGDQHTELQCRFVFRPATESDWTEAEKKKATAAAQKKPPTQDALRAIAEERLLGAVSDLPEPWKNALAKPYRKADGNQADYSMLAGQLNNYTKKNTFDYFIHKDLGGFLTRELDFYIKNELLDWNDIASLKNDTSRLAPLLSKIEVVRTLGEKIVDFLAQLENFQKKLWQKKKFVTEANYCISLDRLASAPELANSIVNNEDQLNEWQENIGIDAEALRYDLSNLAWEEFVIAPKYRYLMIDTKHFDERAKCYILSTIDDIDSSLTGLAVNSENYQALNFLANKFNKSVSGAYIDPPYNTGGDGFPYKDGYRHSSWMAMMSDRVRLSKEFIKNDGALFVSIDERESSKLKLMLDKLFGESNHLASFSWVTDGNSDNQAKVKVLHEEVHAFCVDEPSFTHPPVIDPSVDKSSKIFRDLNP